MKKLLSIIAVLISVCTLSVKAANVDLPTKTDHETVKVNLFYADWCGNCHNFINYFLKNYEEDYADYFEIVTYESGADKTTDMIQANNNLALEIKEYFSISDDDFGWPFVVIGDTYYKIGYGSGTGTEVIEEALKAYQNDSYQDIVSKFAKDNENTKAGTLKEAALNSGIEVAEEDEETGVSDSVVIVIIFVVVIGGLGSLVYFSRKK